MIAANGTAAPIRTSADDDVQHEPAGQAEQRAHGRGRPDGGDRHRPPSASTPPTIATGTSGTTARFTTGDTSDSRPNVATTSGSVAACAASEIPRLSASQRGTRPPPSPPSHAPIGFAHASSPAVASTERRKPASPISAGSTSSSSTAAAPSAAAARPARPDSRASSTTPAMTAARTTDGDPPAAITYATTVPSTATRDDAPVASPQHGPDEPGDDRDVPARDRDDVAHAGRREVRGKRPVHPLPQSDEDAGGEPGLGLRQRPPERVARGVACDLEREARCLDDPQLARVEAARRAGASQVRAVRVIVRRGSQPATDLDDGPGGHHRVRGQRRGDDDRPVSPSSSRRRATWSPSRGDPTDSTVAVHGPPSSGSGRRDGRGRPDEDPDRHQPRPDAGRHERHAHAREATIRHRTDGDQHQPGDEARHGRHPRRGPCRADATPTAAHPVRGRRGITARP